MEPGRGPGPRRIPSNCRERASHLAEPSDGSSSKCLEQGYGKPVKPPRRRFLNFCKRLVQIKEKPSNCPPCPPSEPEESFWDYLFKFDKRPHPEPSTCRIAHRHREACRKMDPRLSDPRYRRTDGHVLIFTEPPRPSCCTSNTEPQPRPPPAYAPPKAVVCRRIAEAASSSFPVFAAIKYEAKVQACCAGLRSFRVPFEECRPVRKPRKPFSCERGVQGAGIAPPMAIDRGTCGGRSVGEVLAEATIPKATSSVKTKMRIVGSVEYEPSVAVNNFSRLQRLQKLTRAADCGKGLSSGTSIGKSSTQADKGTRKMSTETRS